MERSENHIKLDCGRPYAHLHAWLCDELGLDQEDGRWVFRIDGGACCMVAIEALEARQVSGLQLQRTSVEATGDTAALDAFMRAFTLRFISAGG